MRVVGQLVNGNSIICGTNAFRPMCRIFEDDALKTVKSEFSATGLAPMDPNYNTTVYMDGDYLYAATG